MTNGNKVKPERPVSAKSNLKQWRHVSKDSDVEKYWQKLSELDEDFDGDGYITEMDRLKKVDIIKHIPIPLQDKIELRNRLNSMHTMSGGRACATINYKFKLFLLRKWISTKNKLHNFAEVLRVLSWESSLRSVEGVFGAGVGSHFRFLRLFIVLNLFISLLILCTIVIPQAIFKGQEINTENTVESIQSCSTSYKDQTLDYSKDVTQYVIDFLQGTGWMEITYMFYGFYDHLSVTVDSTSFSYDLPFAYICCLVAFMFGSFMFVVHQASVGFKAHMISREFKTNKFNNYLFSAWDFSVRKPYAARCTQANICRKLVADLQFERLVKLEDTRTNKQMCWLYTKRLFINIIVLGSLCGAGYAIYLTTVETTKLTSSDEYKDYNQFVQLLIQYMTPLVISLLNSILPFVYKKMIVFEGYTPSLASNITLIRQVFLKLASLVMLVISIYTEVTCDSTDSCGSCLSIQCWETYFGQNIYKLVVTDFLMMSVKIILLETPRGLIDKYCKRSRKLVEKLGKQEFDISSNNLELLYSQTLLWLGAFFSPLIPSIVLVRMVCAFHMKKLSLKFNFKPNTVPYKASTVKTFFMRILLIAYAVTAIPLIYVVVNMTPSKSCGPFRDQKHMIYKFSQFLFTMPDWVDEIVDWLSRITVLFCIIILLSIIVFHQSKKTSAYKNLTKLLNEQVMQVHRDKGDILKQLKSLESGDKKKSPIRKISSISNNTIEEINELLELDGSDLVQNQGENIQENQAAPTDEELYNGDENERTIQRKQVSTDEDLHSKDEAE